MKGKIRFNQHTMTSQELEWNKKMHKELDRIADKYPKWYTAKNWR